MFSALCADTIGLLIFQPIEVACQRLTSFLTHPHYAQCANHYGLRSYNKLITEQHEHITVNPTAW